MNRPTLFVFILLAACTAHAQTPIHAQTQPSPSDIAAMRSVLQYARGSLDIITLAEPRKRLSCRVDNLTNDTLVCKRRLTHKEQSIALNDIVAVIEPPHSKRGPVATAFIVAGVALGITILVIDPIVALVGGAIVGPIILINSLSPSAPPRYDSHDLVLFERSDLPLLVPMR